MKRITSHHDGHGRTEACRVFAVGNEGHEPEGQCHLYQFESYAPGETAVIQTGFLQFQNGPFDSPGAISGTLSVAVLAALIDHLRRFVVGPLSDRETAIAITKLEEAAMWLRARADRRAADGTLGTMRAGGAK